MAISKFTKTALTNLFSSPATNMYPLKEKVFHEGTRGHIEIDIDQCIFCGMCTRKCPTGALSTDRKEKFWAIERLQCIQCQSCVDCCPKKCLTMKKNYTSPITGTGTVKDVFHARVSDND